jgi:hypothetical protein
MSEAVKAEVRAVRALKHGVAKYAEAVRDASTTARHEVAAVVDKLTGEVERRRGQHNQVVQDLQRARDALRRAAPDRQEACQRAVAAAEAHVAQTKRRLDRARQALQISSTASSEMLKTVQTSEETVAQHSTAASSVLESLDIKLSEIVGGGLGAQFRNAVKTLGVAAELAVSTVDVSRLAGNVAQGSVPTAAHVTSISEMADSRTEDEQQLWRDVETDRRRENSEGPGDVGV